MKQRYDWDKIKLEYLKSHINGVIEFFKDNYCIYTSYIKKKTNGWNLEKKEFIQGIKEGNKARNCSG